MLPKYRKFLGKIRSFVLHFGQTVIIAPNSNTTLPASSNAPRDAADCTPNPLRDVTDLVEGDGEQNIKSIAFILSLFIPTNREEKTTYKTRDLALQQQIVAIPILLLLLPWGTSRI